MGRFWDIMEALGEAAVLLLFAGAIFYVATAFGGH